VTYALATQLVVTLPGPLGEAGMAELAAIWEELRQFGEQIEGVPLAELRDRLTEFEARILDVVQEHAEEPEEAPAEAGGADPTGDGASGGGAAKTTDNGEEPADGPAGSGGSAAQTGSSSSGTGSAATSGSTAESTAGTDSVPPTSEATPSG
jgi:putative peptide zinc metalloprotease protein